SCRQRDQRRAPLAFHNDAQTGESDDEAAGCPVVAALTEDPQPMAGPIVLNDCPWELWDRNAHLDASSLRIFIGLYAQLVEPQGISSSPYSRFPANRRLRGFFEIGRWRDQFLTAGNGRCVELHDGLLYECSREHVDADGQWRRGGWVRGFRWLFGWFSRVQPPAQAPDRRLDECARPGHLRGTDGRQAQPAVRVRSRLPGGARHDLLQ